MSKLAIRYSAKTITTIKKRLSTTLKTGQQTGQQIPIFLLKREREVVIPLLIEGEYLLPIFNQ